MELYPTIGLRRGGSQGVCSPCLGREDFRHTFEVPLRAMFRGGSPPRDKVHRVPECAGVLRMYLGIHAQPLQFGLPAL